MDNSSSRATVRATSFTPLRPATAAQPDNINSSKSQHLSLQLQPPESHLDLAPAISNAEQSSLVSNHPLPAAGTLAPSLLSPPSQGDTSDILSTTTSSGTAMGYLGTSGLLNLFEPDYRGIARNEPQQRSTEPSSGEALPPLELQQSFAETYFEYCWPWCPILDKASFWNEYSTTPPSSLLSNSLALLGTQVRPPIIQHADAAEYYKRAKMQFYMDEESNPLVSLQAIMLFYWWAPRGSVRAPWSFSVIASLP